MKVLRAAAAIVIAAAAVATLRACVVVPLHCQRIVSRTETRTREAVAAFPEVRRSIARANIGALRRCEGRYPADINLYMLLGANYQIVEEWEAAIEVYETALGIDRRPEVYLNLGMCRMQVDQTERAMEAFVIACAFAPRMLDEVPDSAVREAVVQRIEAQYGPGWMR